MSLSAKQIEKRIARNKTHEYLGGRWGVTVEETKVAEDTEIRWRDRDIWWNQHRHHKRKFRFINRHFLPHFQPLGHSASTPDILMTLNSMSDFVDGDWRTVTEIHYQSAVHDPHEKCKATISRGKNWRGLERRTVSLILRRSKWANLWNAQPFYLHRISSIPLPCSLILRNRRKDVLLPHVTRKYEISIIEIMLEPSEQFSTTQAHVPTINSSPKHKP